MTFAQRREIADGPHGSRLRMFARSAIFRAALLMMIMSAGVIVLGGGGLLLAAPSARQEVAAGWGAFELEEWGEAEAAFRRAIEADPALAEAYQGLGNRCCARIENGRRRGQSGTGCPTWETTRLRCVRWPGS